MSKEVNPNDETVVALVEFVLGTVDEKQREE